MQEVRAPVCEVRGMIGPWKRIAQLQRDLASAQCIVNVLAKRCAMLDSLLQQALQGRAQVVVPVLAVQSPEDRVN